jgi:serine/threonine-protein kinase
MIGTGGMADVYFGEDLRLNRQVAIKVLRRDLSDDPTFLTRFKKEAMAAAALSHPNIVSIFDAGEDQGNSYLIMELVNGITLSKYLENQKVSVTESLLLISQILEAVSYSHQNGIIHRDIKPGNIMITDDGQIKVMDFGIARLTNQEGQTLTSTLNILGTAQYISPEQATGNVSDERSDIYAIGCILYELITGRPPFTGETPVSVAFQHVSSEYQSPKTYVVDLNPEIEKIIAVSLAKNADDRYLTAVDMQNDIQKIIRGEKIERILPKTKTSGFSLKTKFILASFAIILIATGSFVFAINNSTPKSIVVPNLIGESLGQAKAFFNGFNVQIKNEPSSDIPQGKISAQEPLPLSKAKQGATLTLTFSTGPGNTTVPSNLLGLLLVNAESEIRDVGLQIAQITPVNSNQAPGSVINVDPAPGSLVPAGTAINLNIASGEITVPGIIGEDKVTASSDLTNAGFLVTTSFTTDPNYPDNSVIAQTPVAGSSEPIGSTVTLIINQLSNASASGN